MVHREAMLLSDEEGFLSFRPGRPIRQINTFRRIVSLYFHRIYTQIDMFSPKSHRVCVVFPVFSNVLANLGFG